MSAIPLGVKNPTPFDRRSWDKTWPQIIRPDTAKLWKAAGFKPRNLIKVEGMDKGAPKRRVTLLKRHAVYVSLVKANAWRRR